MSRLQAAPEAAILPVEDVVSLHNIIMGDIRQQRSIARGKGVRRKEDPRGYAFCMLDSNEDRPRDNTGSIITYLGVLLTKRQTRHWSMLVSFLDGYNSEALANTNYRSFYRMDWTRDEAWGTTWNIETVADRDNQQLIRDAKTSNEWEKIYNTGSSVHFLTPVSAMEESHLEHVRERVISVSLGASMSYDRRFERAMQRREDEQSHSADTEILVR